jgi:hypothetical protein
MQSHLFSTVRQEAQFSPGGQPGQWNETLSLNKYIHTYINRLKKRNGA